jgi:Mg/Co/Ni transporter MgtE
VCQTDRELGRPLRSRICPIVNRRTDPSDAPEAEIRPGRHAIIARMGNVQINEIDGLSVAAITHAQLTTISSAATIAEARAYFAASTSRRSAFVVDGDRFVGSLTPADLPIDGDPAASVLPLARLGATARTDEPASVGRDLALAAQSRRVPVVDADQRLLGVVAVNRTGEWFCGTG